MRAPWIARRSNQSILKEISPGCSLEGLMLKLRVFIGRTDAEAETPILWPPHARVDSLEKDSDVGRDWRQEEKGMTGWDAWMASPTRWT